MAYITDPKEINKFMQGLEEVDYTSYSRPQQTQEEQEPQGQSWGLYNADDGSIWETAKQRLGAQYESMIASNVENPDLSRYANNRFVDQYKDWKAESEKLGVVGNVAAGAVGYAPSIIGGAINPALGGAVMAAQSTPDALIAQYEEGRPFDIGAAADAGMASAATDVLLGGMGKFIPKPGAGMAGQARALGAEVLAEDVTSNVASQIYENLASGRDWDQDTGMAAVVGGVAGAGLRGGFAGVSKALEIPFNQGGEKAITRATDIERKSGEEINPTFANSFVDIENAKSGIRAEIENIGDVDSPELADAINRYNTLSDRGAVSSAQAELGEIIPDLHMTLQGYNVNLRDLNGKEVNLGRDVLGLTDTQMSDSKIRISDTRNRAFEGEAAAAKKGLTQEAFNFKLAESYNKKFSEGNGNLQNNLHYVKERMRTVKAQEAPRQVQSMYNDLNIYMKEYAEAINKRLKTPSKSAEMTDVVRDIGQKINSLAIKLGEDANLMSFRGKKGEFDATRDYMVVSGLHDSAVAQNPKYVFGVADPLKVAKDSTTLDSLAKTALNVGTVGTLPAIQGITNFARRRKVGKELEQAQTLGKALVAPKRRMEEQLAAGNAPAAKEAAVEALRESGVNVPMAAKPEAPVAETPVVREPVAEPTVEAPVEPVVPFAPTPSADAKAKVQPSPKPVEAVVEPAPTPKPKAKAKGKKTPAKKKRQLSAEEVEAAKAKIAADLQAKVQAGAAPRQVEAKSATAPKAKEVAEAPVEAPAVVESAPKPKAKAKAAKSPKAKEKAEDIEEAFETLSKGVGDSVLDNIAQKGSVTITKPESISALKDRSGDYHFKENEDGSVTILGGRKSDGSWVGQEKVVAPKEKPEAKAAKAPKAKEAEPEVKVEQEAPSKAPQEPLGRKQPTRTEAEPEPVESVTEAPEAPKVEEPVAPKEKPYAQRVREPLQKILDEKVSRSDAAKFNAAVLRREQAKQDLKDLTRLEGLHKDYTAEDVSRIVHEIGGMENLRAAAKEAGVTTDQYFKARMMDLEGLRKREAANKTREMKDLLVKKTESSTPVVDTSVAAKKAQREFDGEMVARGYHGDDVAAVNKAIEDGMSHKNARVLAQRLNAERKDSLKEQVKDRAETLKDANAVLKNEGKMAQVDEYLKGMNIEGDKEINKMVSEVFKHRSDEIKPKEMQTLLNKIDRYLDNQLEEYNSLSRAGGKADPRYPEWQAKAAAFRSAQSDLKRNRAQVDRSYSQSSQNAAQAATEHAQLSKEYDALFNQANTRDANANKVVKQKDELVRDLEDKGFTTEEAEAATGEAFFKRETTPMNEREMQKTINKIVDQKARAREEKVAQKTKAVKAEVSQADDATLVEIGEAVADEINYSPKMEGNDDEVAILKAVSDEMSKRGNKTAQRYKAVAEAMLEGAEIRAKFPDNPELWMPANTLQAIQKSYGSGDSSYAGRLGVALKLALTGNKEGVKGFGTLDKQVIQSRITKASGSEEGKFLTGMDDLIVK